MAIMRGIYRPGGGVRRVTSNAGNSAFIKGGFHIKRVLPVDVPVFIGPDIPVQSAVLGVYWSLDCSVFFDGPPGSTFAGVWQPPVTWLSIDPLTGLLEGTPSASGFVEPVEVAMVHDSLAARSNPFRINVAPVT